MDNSLGLISEEVEPGCSRRILAVVVLYKRPLHESQTILGLIKAFESRPDLLDLIELLVWDNSPRPLLAQILPFPFEYRHSSQNAGVSGAYNQALKIAERLSCPWMLLLDQDTTIYERYLDRMVAYSRELETRSEIAAVAPFLLSGKRIVSPAIVRFFGVKLVPLSFSGVHRGELYAANSGTLMRTSALKEIGGYDENFWLDHSDIVVFHRLHQRGKRLYIAGDLELPHLMTWNDYEGSMSSKRYRSFLSAEGAYFDLYRSRFANGIQLLRLFARAIKQYLRLTNKDFSKITREYLMRRIVLSKSQRLLRWNRQSLQRDLPIVSAGRPVQ